MSQGAPQAKVRRRKIGPQPGAQMRFLSTPADIAIYGGAAGGGKSYALLLEALRHARNPGFRAVYFRRKSTELRAAGGLWDTSRSIYPLFGAKPKESNLEWIFPSGARIKFNHCEHDSNRFDHQGSQYALVCFDEVTHFSAEVFWYLVGRLRSSCGVRPYLRATCNPDPDSFVLPLIRWWIDDVSGYPIPDRAGRLRWFVRAGDEFVHADSVDQLVKLAEPHGMREEDTRRFAMSLTFIPSRLEDNPALVEADPTYAARVAAQSLVDRERLANGNWLIRESAGLMFREEWFKVVDQPFPPHAQRVAYWDLAAGEEADADETAGVLLASHEGRYCIEDVVTCRRRPKGVEDLVRSTCERWGKNVTVWIEQEAIGSVGEHLLDHYRRNVLPGFAVYGASARGAGTKVERAKPASSAAEAGNVDILRAGWNQKFTKQAHAFPDGKHDDMVDAFSGAVQKIAESGFRWRSV